MKFGVADLNHSYIMVVYGLIAALLTIFILWLLDCHGAKARRDDELDKPPCSDNLDSFWNNINDEKDNLW